MFLKNYHIIFSLSFCFVTCSVLSADTPERALRIAAGNCNKDDAARLLESGVDVNSVGVSGATALQVVGERYLGSSLRSDSEVFGGEQIAEMLVDKNASIQPLRDLLVRQGNNHPALDGLIKRLEKRIAQKEEAKQDGDAAKK